MSTIFSQRGHPYGGTAHVRTKASRPSQISTRGAVLYKDRTKGQFRPRPLAPPPAPAYIAGGQPITVKRNHVITPDEAIQANAENEKRYLLSVSEAALRKREPGPRLPPVLAGSTRLVDESVGVNRYAYEVYLQSYDRYLEKLASLRSDFWGKVEQNQVKGKAGAVPPKASEPLDAAELADEKAKKARRAAARKRQRAAKRNRDCAAKAESLKTAVETLRLEKEKLRASAALSRAKMETGKKAKVQIRPDVPAAAPAKATGPKAALEAGRGPERQSEGAQAVSPVAQTVPPPGPPLRRRNAQSRRLERRAAQRAGSQVAAPAPPTTSE